MKEEPSGFIPLRPSYLLTIYICKQNVHLLYFTNEQRNVARLFIIIRKFLYGKKHDFLLCSLFWSYFLSNRLKNKSGYDNIWRTVGRILRNSSFPVKLADTLPGNKEAAYSWTTLNALLNKQVGTANYYLNYCQKGYRNVLQLIVFSYIFILL